MEEQTYYGQTERTITLRKHKKHYAWIYANGSLASPLFKNIEQARDFTRGGHVVSVPVQK